MQASADVLRWGAKGHATVNGLAARHMAADMPDFFKASTDRLTEFGDEPDRWKIDGLPNLADSNVPDHSIYTELVGSHPYPALRSQFVQMAADNHIGYTGYLPYRIAEEFDTLVADFALWRREVAAHGPQTPLAQELADDAVRTAGIMGHFVGDASQPLHTTENRDGWVEAANPGGYTRQRGIHDRFETQYVNKDIDEANVDALMKPASDAQGPALQCALDLIADSHQYVDQIYQLDHDGQLDPDRPNPAATHLIENRLAAGAQILDDLWATAWHQSAAVVGRIQDPQ